MKKKSGIFTGLLALTAVLTLSANTAFADELVDSARIFLQTSTDTYNQGMALCRGGCGPELSAPLGALNASLVPLRNAIDSGATSAIVNASANTNNSVLQICAALGTDCGPLPTGMMEGPISANSNQSMGAADDSCGPGTCCALNQFYYQAEQARNFCYNIVNELLGCRKETPFCDYRDHPFTSANWQRCLNESYYRAGLRFAGGRECRCPLGLLSQRNGGCDQFFGQDAGYLNIPEDCNQPDGQGCYGCCQHTPCLLVGDSRTSCQGNNQWECDLCQWTNKAEEAARSQRVTVCDKALLDAAAVFRQQWPTCTTDPIDPPICCDTCGCHSCLELCPIWP